MENIIYDEINRNYTVAASPFLTTAKFFEGYLEKKGRNMFAGWQKRYFKCLEGKVIIYTESKESKQVKGYIQIRKIITIKSIDTKSFSFHTDDREFLLRAESEGLKNKWVEVLEYLIDSINKRKSKGIGLESFELNKSVDNILKKKKNKEDEFKTITKKTADIIKKYGYTLNKEESISKQLLEKTGINKLLNINDPKIIVRMHYGFMFKRQKNHEIYNKRWFFIISQRPLYNEYYSKDDVDLDQKKQKDWIKFNVLYYFKDDKIDESNDLNIYDNKIELENCHKMINYEKDGKYFMNLDAGDRGYHFYCEAKSERDEWFEFLKNSRKTAKEYKLSITQHPRNIELLNSIFLKNEKEFIKKVKEEKNAIVGNIEELSEFNVFEFTLNNFQFHIESTLDGCLCSSPSKLNLLKAYSEFMNKEYLDIIKIFWEKFYDKLSNEEILKTSYLLLKFYDTVKKFNVDDANLLKNGKELTKIYFKKLFQNILSTIENILRDEREFKGTKNEKGLYYTLGPKDLFDILSKTLDLVKDFKHPIIYKELLKIFNVSIFQYAIGVNCVIANQELIMENEYLISVSNNTYNITDLLNSLIDSINMLEVLNEKDINEEIHFKKIMNSINKLSFGAIVRLVYDNKDELSKDFEKENYFDIDIEKIIIKSGEIYGKFQSMMNAPVIKKFWNEVLKLTLCYYITTLLLTARKKKKTKEELILKIKNDKAILESSYSDAVGENLTKSTLKILDDIIDFLEVSQCMISNSCLALRQYIGPAFAYSAAKKFVKLRTDFTKDEIKDCKSQCEEVLNNYNGPKNEESSYFILFSKKIKKNDKDKVYKKSLKIKFGNSLSSKNVVENVDKDSSSDSDVEENKELTKNINENYRCTNLDDFLGDFEEEEEKEENEQEGNKTLYEAKNDEIYIDDDYEEEEVEIIDDIDDNIQIDCEGYFYKKVYNIYKKYYFQVKNGCLYWFEDKDSKMAKNKISLKNVNKIDSSEEKKFKLFVNEKEDIKEYKFKCDLEEEKIKCAKAITRSMKKVMQEDNIPTNEKIEIKPRKKIINDLFQIPNIKIDGLYIKEKVLGVLAGEDFFKMTPEKFEKIKKEKEKIMKKEEKELKKKEKLEKEMLKKEEKEEKKRLKEEKKLEKEKEKEEKKRLKEEKKLEKEKEKEEKKRLKEEKIIRKRERRGYKKKIWE